MKTNSTLLLALLAGLFPGVVEAEAQAEAALAKRAAATRDAVFELRVKEGPANAVATFCFGVFIARNGLALVDMQGLVTRLKPTGTAADGKPLKLGKILGVFPEQELVLMKFDHRPKAIVPLARVEPEVGETIALVTLNQKDPWDGKIPPVVGPVMTKRSGMTPNLRVARFIRVLSLGSGLSFEQRAALGPGCFAIDREGHLVAFTNGFGRSSGQTLITVAPVVALADQIAQLAKEEKDLGFPLPKARNPIDPVALDPDFHPMNMAMGRQDWKEFERRLERLQKRHPQSSLVKSRQLDLAVIHAATKGNPLIDFPKPDPRDPVAQQVDQWSKRAKILATRQLFDDATKALEAAIALSPEDYPADRLNLAKLYAQRGQFEEAERLSREAYPSSSDSISFVETFESILLDLKKPEEADKMSKRAFELYEIYKRP